MIFISVATFSLQNITGLDGQYPFQPIKFANLRFPVFVRQSHIITNHKGTRMVRDVG